MQGYINHSQACHRAHRAAHWLDFSPMTQQPRQLELQLLPIGDATGVVPEQLPQSLAAYELHPTQPHLTRWKPEGPIPKPTRGFGKIVDFRDLQCGDLMFTRELVPGLQGRWIREAQLTGYAEDAAAYTHVAMYVGDGEVLEADVDQFSGKVQVSPLAKYCDAAHALLFLRSSRMQDPGMQCRFMKMGFLRLHEAYAVVAALRGLRKISNGHQFYDHAFPQQQNSVTCGTLIAQAYRKATRICLEPPNGICTPAHLCESQEFAPVTVHRAQLH